MSRAPAPAKSAAARRASPQAQRARPTEAPRSLDSSCWIEFFADTPRADLFAEAIEAVESLVVPVLTIYEVVKKLSREVGDEAATAALSLMQRGKVIEVDLSLTLEAALSGLPMADSLIYATAQRHGAELWTQDAHFEGRPGVRYFAKPSAAGSPAH